jgi:hypothetical protein
MRMRGKQYACIAKTCGFASAESARGTFVDAIKKVVFGDPEACEEACAIQNGFNRLPWFKDRRVRPGRHIAVSDPQLHFLFLRVLDVVALCGRRRASND